MYPCLSAADTGVVIRIQVLPRSSRNQVVGLQGESLKIKITSPPVDGAANACCRNFLAKLFGVAKGRVSIVFGETNKNKRLLVEGVSVAEVEQILRPFLD